MRSGDDRAGDRIVGEPRSSERAVMSAEHLEQIAAEAHPADESCQRVPTAIDVKHGSYIGSVEGHPQVVQANVVGDIDLHEGVATADQVGPGRKRPYSR